MAVVYLLSEDGEVLSLDSTERFTKGRQNTVTKSSVMSGQTASDGYIVGNTTATFNGICSYNKINRGRGQEVLPPTPPELDALIDRMVLSETRFQLSMSTPNGIVLLHGIDDVVITSHQLVRDDFLDSIRVTISVEQVFISQGASVTTLAVLSQSAADQAAAEKDKGTNTPTEDPLLDIILETRYSGRADIAGAI